MVMVRFQTKHGVVELMHDIHGTLTSTSSKNPFTFLQLTGFRILRHYGNIVLVSIPENCIARRRTIRQT